MAGCRSTTRRAAAYESRMYWKARSFNRYSQPCRSSRRDFRKRAHIIGVAVSETSSETPMAIESVTANSRNRRPTMPLIRRMGMNTATSEVLIDRTVKPISLDPLSAASMGCIPCSR